MPAVTAAPSRRSRTPWIIGGIVLAAVVVALFPLIGALNSSSPQQSSAAPARADNGNNPNNNNNPQTTLSGPARCPVGTSATALTIANALVGNPVYVDPASSLLTAAQAGRLQTEISQADPGRIRMAVLTNATLTQGGSQRSLANAISSCPGDAAGVTLVTNDRTTYLVTSYTNYQGTSQAVGAALNTHGTLAAGLRDAVRRMATIDPGS